MLNPGGTVKKDKLTFAAKFIWILFRHRLSPKAADNIIMWDRAVLVAAMVAVFEIVFSRLLWYVIHERDFKASTTYPFPCLSFEFCRALECPFCMNMFSELLPG